MFVSVYSSVHLFVYLWRGFWIAGQSACDGGASRGGGETHIADKNEVLKAGQSVCDGGAGPGGGETHVVDKNEVSVCPPICDGGFGSLDNLCDGGAGRGGIQRFWSWGTKQVFPEVGDEAILIPEYMCCQGDTIDSQVDEVYGDLGRFTDS